MEKFKIDILNDQDFEEKRLNLYNKKEMADIIIDLRNQLVEAMNMNERSDSILRELKSLRAESATKKSIEVLQAHCLAMAITLEKVEKIEDETTKMSSLYSEVVKKDILPKLNDMKRSTDPNSKAIVVKHLAEGEDGSTETLKQKVLEKIPTMEGRQFKPIRCAVKKQGKSRPVIFNPSADLNLQRTSKS